MDGGGAGAGVADVADVGFEEEEEEEYDLNGTRITFGHVFPKEKEKQTQRRYLTLLNTS